MFSDSQGTGRKSHFQIKPSEEITSRAFTGIYDIDKEIVMNIVDAETLVKLYNTSHYIASILNDQDVLENLVKYYNLPVFDNFTDFLQAYDRKYVTHRCTNYYDQRDCFYRAIEQDNYEMIHYFKNFPPNSLNLVKLLKASAGGNYDVLKETLEIAKELPFKIDYSDLLQEAIKNNKPKNFRLIYESVPKSYHWSGDMVGFATMYVSDVNFYKEILEKFPYRWLYPQFARHWSIFEYILSTMPTRPDYSDILLNILYTRNDTDFLKMIEKKYGDLFTPQEIYKILKATAGQNPEFSELMFDKYLHKLPVEMRRELTT
jgi:hypothetical protein